MKRLFTAALVLSVALTGCGGATHLNALPGGGNSADSTPRIDPSSIHITHQGAARVLSLRVFENGAWQRMQVTTTVTGTAAGKTISIDGTIANHSFTANFAQNVALNQTVISYPDEKGGTMTETEKGLVGTPSSDAQLLNDVEGFTPDHHAAPGSRKAMFGANAGGCAASCAVFLLAASPELWALCWGTCIALD